MTPHVIRSRPPAPSSQCRAAWSTHLFFFCFFFAFFLSSFFPFPPLPAPPMRRPLIGMLSALVCPNWGCRAVGGRGVGLGPPVRQRRPHFGPFLMHLLLCELNVWVWPSQQCLRGRGHGGLARTRAPSHRSLAVVFGLPPAATHRYTDKIKPLVHGMMCSHGLDDPPRAPCDSRRRASTHRTLSLLALRCPNRGLQGLGRVVRGVILLWLCCGCAVTVL